VNWLPLAGQTGASYTCPGDTPVFIRCTVDWNPTILDIAVGDVCPVTVSLADAGVTGADVKTFLESISPTSSAFFKVTAGADSFKIEAAGTTNTGGAAMNLLGSGAFALGSYAFYGTTWVPATSLAASYSLGQPGKTVTSVTGTPDDPEYIAFFKRFTTGAPCDSTFVFRFTPGVPWMQGCEKKYEVFIPYTGVDREVTVTYLGLADKYLYQYGGGHPAKIVVPADETWLELSFLTARVPDGQEGGTGAIVLSTPSLPGDTSLFFTFWNEPDLSEMVYIPRTTMYGGLLELNIRGGSPDLLRSFNGGATWESAWGPVTGLDLERLDHEIRFREPDGCRLYTVDIAEPSQTGIPEREVELPAYTFTVTDPLDGLNYVKNGKDFLFTVTLTGPYAAFTPEVLTTRRLSPDEVFITKQEDGSFRVRIPAIRENIRIIIRVNSEELPAAGNEYVEVTRVWTAEGEVYIQSTAPGEAQIYTLTGARVKSVPVAAGQTARTTLPSGFHFVKLNGKTYKVGTP
jgi:hypothetical protein